MKNRIILFILLCASIFIISCSEDEPIMITKPQLKYTFFVAGHTYGSPGVNNIGLHPPFEAFYETINTYPKMFTGILTGDIVRFSTSQDWDEVDASLQQLNMPIHFAVGNHDMMNRTLVESRYGATYKSFTKDNDLFIILDLNLANWKIEGEQLDFLINTLDSLGEGSDHIFVFFHQLMWWKNNHLFSNNKPNSFEGKADSLNFWTELEPRFNVLDKPIFLFAGDVGAVVNSESLMYYKDVEITYISSGMGRNEKDNFIIVEVWSDGHVYCKPFWLNNANNLNRLGKIEDYPPL
jgi:hypothetical protein